VRLLESSGTDSDLPLANIRTLRQLTANF